MGYYTLIPHIRNDQDTRYIGNFCQGKWRVLVDGNWLQLTPENTRIRDKNNKNWVELCAGHVVEVTLEDRELDCKCYSKNFNEALNRDLNTHVFEKTIATDIDFLLYGNVLQVYDQDPYVYILFYTTYEDRYKLRLYLLNKSSSSIDNVLIDIVSSIENCSIYVDGELVINCGNLNYTVDADYTISANLSDSIVPQKFFANGNIYQTTDCLSLNETKLFDIQSVSNSFVNYEQELCLVTYYDNNVILYDVNGNIRAESISDANKVFFFDRNEQLISVEGYDNYIRIKGIDHA